MQKKPTILDVAHRAGVAVGTVSRFINGQKVKESNQRAIQDAISVLGYRANALARAMKTERTQTLGLLVPLFDDLNASVLGVLVERLKEHGYLLLTFNQVHEPAAMRDVLVSISSHRIDGLFLAGVPGLENAVKELLAEEVPVVIYNNDLPAVDTDKVFMNDRKASSKIVTRMIEFGHKNIGIVTGALRTSTAANRLLGYMEAHESAGFEAKESLVYRGDWSRKSGFLAMQRFLTPNQAIPTAVLFSNYNMALGGLEYLNESNSAEDHNIDIASFDDPDFFSLMRPSITAVQLPTTQIAEHLVDLMLSRLDGSAVKHPRTININCDIAMRDSLGPVDRFDRKRK